MPDRGNDTLISMDEKELKKIVVKALEQFNCRKYSFQKSGGKNDRVISVLFSLGKEEAAWVHEKLSDRPNFYAFGWYLSPLFMRETNEYRIDFKKV